MCRLREKGSKVLGAPCTGKTTSGIISAKIVVGSGKGNPVRVIMDIKEALHCILFVSGYVKSIS
jgi:hypothetical protein